MYQSLFCESSLYRSLLSLDEAHGASIQEQGCVCGGRLHLARYPRKPRGGPAEIEAEAEFRRRLSYCCAVCRRRSTPGSVLFLGRKVYFGAVVVLVSVLRQGANPARLSQLQEWLGVSGRTVRRWRDWWLKDFVKSRLWRAGRGRVRGSFDERRLPLSLLESFEGEGVQEKLVGLLQFVRPLTIGRAACAADRAI